MFSTAISRIHLSFIFKAVKLMVSVINSVETGHEDMIHDAQFDYYGTKLATCSSDRSIKVFDISGGQQLLLANLNGHEGPVWQISWAHPIFGGILASCGYDSKVIIWKEIKGTWDKLYDYSNHDSSVNSVCFAPHEFGLILACGSSDGSISIISTQGDGNWDCKKITNAHTIGCNAVSWAPYTAPNALFNQGLGELPVKQFVSGGCDNLVKIWRDDNDQWVEDQRLEGHSDWVRDVAWAPSIGLAQNTIATCSQDILALCLGSAALSGFQDVAFLSSQTSFPPTNHNMLEAVVGDCRVIIWTNDGTSSQWVSRQLDKFNDVVWHVSWSIPGDVLAVSGGDNKVTLWKEYLDGQWTCISDINKGQGQIIDQHNSAG